MKTLARLIAASLLFVGCADKPEPQSEPKKHEQKTESMAPPIPDVGGVKQVSVTATGIGVTPAAAVNEALKSAIVQVNGTSISSSAIQTNVGLAVDQSSTALVEHGMSANATGELKTSGESQKLDLNYDEKLKGKTSIATADAIRGQAFAEEIRQSSKGNISEFKVVSVIGPNDKSLYTVTVEAKIAKFSAPSDSSKIKIVIAPLKSSRDNFNFAGELVASSQVAAGIRQRIIDALSQTGRFIILDRQFDQDIQGELDLIASGQSPSNDLAKLGQSLSADLVWIGVINNFSYEKSVRRLETSDRQLVSFSGGWSVSQRLVNVATKQIMISTTIEGKAPSVAPTTLGASVNKNSTVQAMEGDIVKQATEAILLRTFPISIVDLDGTSVVMSQGGQALTAQMRYKVFVLGREMKDPQTGQSLGRVERYCCDVVIDRVTPTLSYGTLENVKITLEGVRADSLQIREALEKTTSANRSQGGEAPTEARADVVGKAPPRASVPKSVRKADEREEKPVIKANDW